jgi:glycosyltransferase involved in cell wall biosynthesis
MTVYNESRWVRTSVDSMLAQTYNDFHFLIVDDASTDDTREIIRSYDDPRIGLVCLEKNVGQTAALNVGLKLVKTPWFARMDADDYSPPTRLETEMRTLADDPSLDCVGTWAWTFLEQPDDPYGEIVLPEDYSEMLRRLLRSVPMIHGTLVARTESFLDIGGYDERYRYAADMELYDRLLPKYRAKNIPEKLLGIRHHPGQGQRTRTSLDEIIAIQSRRLKTDRYTPEERRIIQITLSRQLIVLARQVGGKGHLVESLSILSRALRISPKTFPWHSFSVFIGYSIPERHRNRLKEVVSRVLSPAKT